MSKSTKCKEISWSKPREGGGGIPSRGKETRIPRAKHFDLKGLEWGSTELELEVSELVSEVSEGGSEGPTASLNRSDNNAFNGGVMVPPP